MAAEADAGDLSAGDDFDTEEEGAPPVVAVVVTCDSGPWLEDALGALADQDYPNLSVLVLDAASAEDPTPRVAAALPGAYIRRLETNAGFGPSVNEILHVVEGASHYLLCHDDVAPDPNAVRLLLEEAYRSNAGIAVPKLVDWDEPTRLLSVGLVVDKSGATEEQIGRGEPDQEQYDAVRDVFVAPGGCTLVRADLFTTLGGFDPHISMFGEDLDLSWRAQVLGARVIVVPDARVRHLEAASAGRRPVLGQTGTTGARGTLVEVVRPLQLRHRLRAVLKAYSRFHLARVLPQLALLAVGEMLFALATRRRDVAASIWRAWRWNLSELSSLRSARGELQRKRALPDREIRRLQARGSARLTAFLRGQLTGASPAQAITAAGRDFADQVRRGELRLHLSVWATLAVVLLAGSRHLLTRPLPAVGQFLPLPDSPWTLLRMFASGWRTTGLGSEAPAPLAFFFLGAAGLPLAGAMGLLQKVLVLGCLPAGLFGIHRLARPLESDRAPLVAVVAYAALPLPYNALAGGRLGGLISYAVAPWVLGALARATRMAPYDSGPERGLVLDALPLAILLAVAGAFAPVVVIVSLLTAVGIVVGSLLAGGSAGALRGLAVTGFAVLGTVALLFPWSLSLVLPGAEWSAVAGFGPTALSAPSLTELLRFQTGPMGAGVLGWGVLGAAVLGLLLGGTWRLQWSVRLWIAALAGWGITWTLVRGWTSVPGATPEAMLAPAAASVALAVAMGVSAFERQLRAYRFGWRQLASILAGAALVLGTLPLAGEAFGGDWNSEGRDHARVLGWMKDKRADGMFRVLWVGQPEVVPGDGWHLRDDLVYLTSRDGPPDATSLWPASSEGATRLIADAVAVARQGSTTRLGRLLAPMGIRYLALPRRAAPEGRVRREPSAELLRALAAQIDLRRVETDESLIVYENAAWIPGRAALSADAAAVIESPGSAAGADLAPAQPVLPRARSPFRFTGRLDADSTVFLAEGASRRWQLTVDGRAARRDKALGWANSWSPGPGGRAVLAYRSSPVRFAALALELALWIAAIVFVRRRRRAVGVDGARAK